MNKIKLPKKDRTDWLNALRSGEYNQDTGELATGEGYCCLGVYCKVIGMDDYDIISKTMIHSLHNDLLAKYEVPQCLRYNETGENKSKLYNENQDRFFELFEERDFVSLLVELNDRGWSFKVIADIIEDLTVGV
jgi:hypothetical protein